MSDPFIQEARNAYGAWIQSRDLQRGIEAAERFQPVISPPSIAELLANRIVTQPPERPSRPAWAESLVQQGVAERWVDLQVGLDREPWVVLRESSTAPREARLPFSPQTPQLAQSPRFEINVDGKMPGSSDIAAYLMGKVGSTEWQMYVGANQAWMQGGIQALFSYWRVTNFKPFQDAELRLKWLQGFKLHHGLSDAQMRLIDMEIGRSARELHNHPSGS